MNTEQKFFICNVCGNLIGFVKNKGTPLMCCGKAMTYVAPNTVEASVEKHLPAAAMTKDGLKVDVGSVLHPMTQEHHITFVYVQTKNGGQCKYLNINDTPSAIFNFFNDKPIAVYAYCNLHGLWKTDIV